MKTATKIYIAAFALGGLNGNAQVTPSISSVSGTMQVGSILTIDGTNMEMEDKTNWDGFFTTHPDAWSFEGTSKTLDGYSAIGGGGAEGIYDTTVKLMGNQSIKFHTSGVHTANLGDYNAFNLGSSSPGHWFRWYARWNSNQNLWPTSHIKMFYLTASAPGQRVIVQPSNTLGNTLPAYMISEKAPFNVSAPIPSGQMENGRWYLFEAHVVQDGSLLEVWMDNVKIFYITGSALPYQQAFLMFGLINECCSTDPNFDLSHWWDGMVVSTSRIYPSSLVEVGNSANYATATKKVQELTKISDAQLQFKLDTTGLGAGPCYLWVTNNRQQRSAAYTLCAPTGVNENNLSNSSISIYPNPFSASTTIDFSNIKKSASDNLSFYVYNLLGEEIAVYNNIAGDKLVIEKSAFGGGTKGMYFYKAMLNGENAGMGKLVVE